MAAPKRSEAERERDLARIAELYCDGRRQADIAAHLGVTQQQVSYDLKVLRRRWQERSAESVDRWIGETLARINALELEYWDAWRRSQRVRTRVVEESNRAPTAGTGAAPVRRRVVIEETPVGDPAHLAGVQRCITARVDLLGLAAPARARVGGGATGRRS